MGLSEESSWADVDTGKSQRAMKLEAGSVTLVVRAFEGEEGDSYHWLLVCNELGISYHPLGRMTVEEVQKAALEVATGRLHKMVADLEAAAKAVGWESP